MASAAPAPTAQPGGFGALFEAQAQTYAQYRLGYPPHVLAAIYEFLGGGAGERKLAVDVACGTGQVAVSLSRDFQQVVAQDSSAAQIQHAEQQPNIHYEQAPAEATGLPDGCADLVTAAQSMHWLDAPAFFRECRRILKLSGALAVFSYIPLEIRFDGNAAASEVLKAALLESNPFFHPHRQRFVLHLFEGQKPTPDDFGVVQQRVLDMHRERSVDQIVGWMRSMSGWAGYEAAYPAAAEQLAEALVAALGVPDATTPVPMTWPLVMMLAKQPRPL